MDNAQMGVFAFSHAGINREAFTVVIAPDEATARKIIESILKNATFMTDHPIKLVGALDRDKVGLIVVSEGE